MNTILKYYRYFKFKCILFYKTKPSLTIIRIYKKILNLTVNNKTVKEMYNNGRLKLRALTVKKILSIVIIGNLFHYIVRICLFDTYVINPDYTIYAFIKTKRLAGLELGSFVTKESLGCFADIPVDYTILFLVTSIVSILFTILRPFFVKDFKSIFKK